MNNIIILKYYVYSDKIGDNGLILKINKITWADDV